MEKEVERLCGEVLASNGQGEAAAKDERRPGGERNAARTTVRGCGETSLPSNAIFVKGRREERASRGGTIAAWTGLRLRPRDSGGGGC